MFKLAPSLLSADFSKLGEQIREVEESGAHYIHVDVMDGHFVPNISMGIPVIKSIRKITDMTLDVHLMITEPERYLESFAEAGADIINFHAETCRNSEHMLEIISQIRKLNKRPAVAISPETDVAKIFDVADKVEMILVLSVHPGFGGQNLMSSALDKAHKLADFIANEKLLTQIEMDGGINISNVRSVIDSGVNIVVAGSAVFGAENGAGDAVRDFYNVFKEYGAKK